MSTQSVFLAAPNASQMQAVADDIVMPVLRGAGLRVVRMPNLGSPDIASDILEAVRRCDAMVAITIGRNPNVFWELGLACALGKPVLLLGDDVREFGLLENAVPCILRIGDDRDTRARLASELARLLAV